MSPTLCILGSYLAKELTDGHERRMQVRRYERERVENKSTYWLLFELIWRDYFRFISIKFGDKLFKLGGLRDVSAPYSRRLNGEFFCQCVRPRSNDTTRFEAVKNRKPGLWEACFNFQ